MRLIFVTWSSRVYMWPFSTVATPPGLEGDADLQFLLVGGELVKVRSRTWKKNRFFKLQEDCKTFWHESHKTFRRNQTCELSSSAGVHMCFYDSWEKRDLLHTQKVEKLSKTRLSSENPQVCKLFHSSVHLLFSFTLTFFCYSVNSEFSLLDPNKAPCFTVRTHTPYKSLSCLRIFKRLW